MKTTLLCAVLCLVSISAFAQSEEMLSMANSASTKCAANHDGNLYIQTDSKSGDEYGLCQISKTEAYEEWCLYRKDMNIDTKECPNLVSLIKDQK